MAKESASFELEVVELKTKKGRKRKNENANVEEGKRKRAKTENSKKYDMNHRYRGHAFIFNQYNFSFGNAPREGSHTDIKKLKETFSKLNFDVSVLEDLTVKQLEDKLKEIAEMDHSEADCLLIVMMTHGNKGQLCAYDKPYDVSLLWESFKGEACPTLISKPKIFLIQACRGSSLDKGVNCCGWKQDKYENEDAPSEFTLPSYSDFFIANATFEGYAAFRHIEKGSCFIQNLCEELLKRGASKNEICQIFTNVNQRIALNFETKAPGYPELDKKKQMPNFFSTLTKALYFELKKRKRN